MMLHTTTELSNSSAWIAHIDACGRASISLEAVARDGTKLRRGLVEGHSIDEVADLVAHAQLLSNSGLILLACDDREYLGCKHVAR